MDWRLSNSDSNYDEWNRCPKCHNPYQAPKTLPCLHTVCSECIIIHNGIGLRKYKHTFPDQDIAKYTFPCPICAFPCRLPDGPEAELTNDWMLQVIYRERVQWWEESIALWAERRHSSFFFTSNKKRRKQDTKKQNSAIEVNRPDNAEETLLTQGTDQENKSEKEVAERATTVTATVHDAFAATVQGAKAAAVLDAEAATDWSTGAVAGLSQETTVIQGAEASAVLGEESSAVHRAKRANFLDSLDKKLSWSWEDKLEACVRKVVRQNLIEHWICLDRNLVQPTEPEKATVSGSGFLRHLFDFDLRHGTEINQCLRSSAMAVNPATGKVMVADSSRNKIIFFKPNGKLFGHKNLRHPIVACSFKTDNREPIKERFFALGRKRKGPRIHIIQYDGPVNKNPDSFHASNVDNVSDATGYLLIDDIPYVSLGYENKSIWLEERRFREITSTDVLKYPTHIAKGIHDTIVISDTGNHRIAVLCGYNYDNKHFIGQYGHGDGQLFWPLGVAVDNRGRIFVCDANNYRVQVFNSEYEFESIPLKNTFRMSPFVHQDVKPIDCAMDRRQRLLVLFRGKSYTSLQCFAYEHPVWCIYPEELSCFWTFLRCCNKNARNRRKYQRI